MIRLKLKEVMQAKKVGQSRLSRLANMDVKAIQRFYAKPYTNMTLETLDRLATALQVHPCELIEYIPPSAIEKEE